MHGTSYNLDAKIEIYEDRFKWIFARLGELLHQDGLTPDYLDPFKVELSNLRKDLQDNNTTVNKLIEDVDLEHKKYLEQLSQKLDDSVKKLENDILSAQIGGNTGLVSSLQILYDELKKYHDQDKGELETRLVNIEADVVTSRNDLLNFETETKARFDSMKNIMDVHEKFIGTEIGKINAIMDDNKEELISQVDDLDKKVDRKVEDSKNELTTQVASLDNKLTSEISSIDQKYEKELEKTITAINSVQSDLDKEIVSRTSELDRKITTQIDSTKQELLNEIQSTKNNLEQNITSSVANLDTKINDTKDNLEQNINTTRDNITQLDTKVDNLRPLIITESQIQQMINSYHNQLMEKLYPIGSVYFSMDRNLQDPNTLLGTSFTWERLPEGAKLRNHSNANDTEGTDDIDINHSHDVQFRYGSFYGQIVLDNTRNSGFPSSYDKNSNQPIGWNGIGSTMQAFSPGTSNNCVQEAKRSIADGMHIYQCGGRTGFAFHDQRVNVMGYVVNLKCWKRTR